MGWGGGVVSIVCNMADHQVSRLDIRETHNETMTVEGTLVRNRAFH